MGEAQEEKSQMGGGGGLLPGINDLFLPRVSPDHAGRPVRHLLWCPAGEGARASPGAGGGAEGGQTEAGVGGRGRGQLCSAVPGPRPGRARRGLTERIKDFSTTVWLVPPCPFPSILLAPRLCRMRSREFWASGRGQALGACSVRRDTPTWRAETANLGTPKAER